MVQSHWAVMGKFRLGIGDRVVRLSLFAIAAGFGSAVVYRAALNLHRIGPSFKAPLHAEDWLALAVTLSLIFSSLTTKPESGIDSEDSHSTSWSGWPIVPI